MFWPTQEAKAPFFPHRRVGRARGAALIAFLGKGWKMTGDVVDERGCGDAGVRAGGVGAHPTMQVALIPFCACHPIMRVLGSSHYARLGFGV